ncbi:proline racemase family protein [Desulfovibrio sp. OttesenSCG-928-G15]|nr:proline racemase family protein [Desulfovibrio sp. OttesenSCG-928-G15]
MTYSRMLQAVDTHCAGLAGRVITGGVPHIPGDSAYEQMQYLRDHDDQIRLLTLREPRGYPALCSNIIVPPKNPKAAAGYIIMEQVEYPLMSGTNTISVATVLLETGMVPMVEPLTRLTLESPGGLIDIEATCKNGKVQEIKFRNIPAFAVHLDAEIDVPTLGKVTVDVAWGGMFYAIADVRQFKGLELKPEHGGELCRIASMVRQAAHEQLPVSHPDFPDVGITISQLSGPADIPGADWKNSVTMASGTVDWNNPSTWKGGMDRSPCGTGTSAKMACLYAKGELKLNQKFRHAGVLNTIFTGELVEETNVGPYKAVVPTIGGQAWITGYYTYVLDPTDPFPNGYTCGDIWG